MAQAGGTRSLGSWNNDTVTAELDYNNQNEITALRVVNNGTVPVYFEVVQGERIGTRGRKYSATFLPGTTTEIPIPTGQAQRIQQLWDSTRGRWDGLDIMTVIPAP